MAKKKKPTKSKRNEIRLSDIESDLFCKIVKLSKDDKRSPNNFIKLHLEKTL